MSNHGDLQVDQQSLLLTRCQRIGISAFRLLLAVSMSIALLLLVLCSLSVLVSQNQTVSVAQTLPGTWYVSPLGDDSNSCDSETAPCRGVQAALDRAAVDDIVKVAQGLYTDTTGTVAQIVMNVTLQGGWNETFTVRDPGAHPTVLDAQSGGPVIVIRGPVGFGPISPKIDGFKLTNGNGTGVVGCIAPGAEGCGGGIFGTNTTPHIRGNTITGNVATSRGQGFGGGIYLQGQIQGGVIERNIIEANLAAVSNTAVISGWGGGLCLYNIAATVYDNLIHGNIASSTRGWGYGGGILLYHSAGQVISNTVIDNIASRVAVGELSGWGGGISVVQSRDDEASIIDNEIQGNIASLAGQGWGGGIQIASSKALVSGNRIIGNTSATSARGDGGGIYGRYGSWTIRDNHILSNTSTTSGTGFGGGCQLEYGDVILENNLISGNQATEARDVGFGGGVNMLWCTGSIVRHNIIRGNTAAPGGTGWGGGLSIRFGPVTVEGNQIMYNQATLYGSFHSWGGGVRIEGAAPVTLTNNIIAHNQARTEGGGIHIIGHANTNPGHAILIHNTLVENTRGQAGHGIYVAQHGSVAMTNNIIVSHTFGIFCEADSSMANVDYTLFYGNSVADTAGAVISGHVITGAPGFVDPSNEDFHLRWTSAAIDRGTITEVDNDIDGDARPDGDGVDVGADEFIPFRIYLPSLIRNSS